MDEERLIRRFYARFESRIQKLSEAEGGCWLWLGDKGLSGHGRVPFRGVNLQAHRVSYQLVKGPIPEGLEIDHLCRRSSCVNPDHLEAVTAAENSQRHHRRPPGEPPPGW